MSTPRRQDDGLLPVNTRVQQSGVYGGTRFGTVIKSNADSFTVKWDIHTVASIYNRDYLKDDIQCPITVLATPASRDGVEGTTCCKGLAPQSECRCEQERKAAGHPPYYRAAPSKPAPDTCTCPDILKIPGRLKTITVGCPIHDPTPSPPAPDALRVRAECDWPVDQLFTFMDDPGEHDPCYVVMPGGATLVVNHHAGEGVDIARAKFIVDACNAALSAAPVPPADGPTMEQLRKTISDEWGSHLCYRNSTTCERVCAEGHCRCADIARAILANYALAPSPAVAGEAVAWRWKYKTQHIWQYCSTDATPPSEAIAERLYASPPVRRDRETIARALFKNRSKFDDKATEEWFRLYAKNPKQLGEQYLSVWWAYSDADAILQSSLAAFMER